MMIHDIDLILSLVHDEVASVDAVGSPLVGLTEDMASARVRFAGGCVADLVASRVSLKAERRLRLFAEDCYLSLDLNARKGTIVRPTGKLTQARQASASAGAFDPSVLAGAGFEELLDVQPLAVEDRDPLAAQLAAFVAAVQGRGPVVVTGDDGCRAVDLAERILSALSPKPSVPN